MMKDLEILGIQGTYLTIMKAIYSKHIVNKNSRKLNAFSLKPGREQGCPFSPYLFSVVHEFLARAIR